MLAQLTLLVVALVLGLGTLAWVMIENDRRKDY